MKKIFSLLLALVMACSLSVSAFAAPVDEVTIDTTRTGNIDLWKYDLTNAEKDGIWNSSYVSTGVRDVNGVESILGDTERLSPLNENGTALYYRGVVIVTQFEFMCYTVEDAVDWLSAPTA